MIRADCRNGARPCAQVRCRYHLSDLWGKRRPADAPTCALDIAETGEHSVNELATLLGTTHKTVERLELHARRRIEGRLARLHGVTAVGAPA